MRRPTPASLRRSIKILMVVAMVGALTACAASGPASSADLQAIGARYLELVQPLNEANCTFNAVLLVPNASLDDMKQGAADDAMKLRAFADGMRAIGWPPELAADARDLIKAVAANAAAAQIAAEARTLAAFHGAFPGIRAANSAAARAGNVIRTDLGLPGVSRDPCTS